MYELYTVDDIFAADGTKLVDAGAKLATSDPTNDSGFTWFDVDVPIRAETYPDSGNSGKYRIVEITAPAGYLLDNSPIEIEFTYAGQEVAWQVVDGTNTNLRTTVNISKQDVTNGKELPGAKLEIPSIANICADDTIDLRELGSEKKVALFVVTPDTTTAYNFLAAVMFQQCFQILVDIADHRPDKRLPRHLRFLLDEFPNIGMIPDFQILISTIRSRDIACTLIYQSLNQLKSQYKDDWATIYENCDSMIVLGAGGNPENLEFFSKALGKATIEVMNTSENKGSQGSYTKSYQALGRELMTPEEIRTMPRNWCLLMISGVAPFYSRKYNLKDHPNYHLVEAEGGKPFDYDKRAEQSFADFISNVKDVKTVKLCAENNN